MYGAGPDPVPARRHPWRTASGPAGEVQGLVSFFVRRLFCNLISFPPCLASAAFITPCVAPEVLENYSPSSAQELA